MKTIEILENVDLKKYNSYGIGGFSKYLVKPYCTDELMNLLAYLQENNIKYYILGGGTNIILPDQDFDGVIINLANMNYYKIDEGYVYVEAGHNLSSFVKKMLDLDYINFTNLFGIPGTIGGALVGNAGAYGSAIFDDLESVTIIKDGLIETIPKKNISYSYRYTEFKNNPNIIIIGATFKLVKGDGKESFNIALKRYEEKKASQPLDTKNAGSVFKNGDNYAAWKIIDECNLRGCTKNDAQISEKHTNFIINLGNAKSSDIIDLINEVKKIVLKQKNIELELEQIIVKW